MKISSAALLASAVVLAACASNTDIKSPSVDVTIKHKHSKDRIIGYSEPVVRTLVRGHKESQLSLAETRTQVSRTEVKGAHCAMDSAEMSATFTTPAVLRLPKFKRKPTSVRVKCETDSLKADYTIDPSLDGVVVVGASPAGLIAAAVTAGIAATKDSWSYGANNVAVWITMTEK